MSSNNGLKNRPAEERGRLLVQKLGTRQNPRVSNIACGLALSRKRCSRNCSSIILYSCRPAASSVPRPPWLLGRPAPCFSSRPTDREVSELPRLLGFRVLRWRELG